MSKTSLQLLKNEPGKRLDDLSKDEIIGRPNVEFTKRVVPHFEDAKVDNERPKNLFNTLNFLSAKCK